MEENMIYHVYNRGINSGKIFFEEKNYAYFLRQYDKYLSSFADTLTYCLLPNQFQLLVRVKKLESIPGFEPLPTKIENMSPVQKAFRDFFISYSKSINKMYSRTGALLEYKFKRKLLLAPNHILRTIAYMHLSPVRSDLCSEPGEWKFSSYNHIMRKFSSIVKVGEVLNLYGGLEDFVHYHEDYRNPEREAKLLFKNLGTNKRLL